MKLKIERKLGKRMTRMRKKWRKMIESHKKMLKIGSKLV